MKRPNMLQPHSWIYAIRNDHAIVAMRSKKSGQNAIDIIEKRHTRQLHPTGLLLRFQSRQAKSVQLQTVDDTLHAIEMEKRGRAMKQRRSYRSALKPAEMERVCVVKRCHIVKRCHPLC